MSAQRIRPLSPEEWSPEVREILGSTHERVARLEGKDDEKETETLNILKAALETLPHTPLNRMSSRSRSPPFAATRSAFCEDRCEFQFPPGAAMSFHVEGTRAEARNPGPMNFARPPGATLPATSQDENSSSAAFTCTLERSPSQLSLDAFTFS